MILKLSLLLIACACVILAYIFGDNILFSQQWPLYEALRSTASIIFAVAGVWLAIIYPERIKSPFTKTHIDPVFKKGFSQLFSPIEHSIIVIVIVLIAGWAAQVVKQVDFLMDHITTLRKLSFSFLTCLTLFQIYTVLSVLVPAISIKDKNEQDARIKRYENKLEK